MHPVDLGREVYLGPPRAVTGEMLDRAAQGAADAIAWHVCQAAAQSRVLPQTARLQIGRDAIDSALVLARGRLYSRLAADAAAWMQAAQYGSVEHKEALRLARLVLAHRGSFAEAARARIDQVLEAAGGPGPRCLG